MFKYNKTFVLAIIFISTLLIPLFTLIALQWLGIAVSINFKSYIAVFWFHFIINLTFYNK